MADNFPRHLTPDEQTETITRTATAVVALYNEFVARIAGVDNTQPRSW